MKTINKTKKQLRNKLEETKRRITLLKTSTNRDDNTEALLQQSEEKYRAIFNSVNDILILISKTGRILDVNDKIKEIGGYEKEELIGKNIKSLARLMRKKSFVIVAKNFMERMVGIDVKPYEIEMFKKNGELAIVEVSAATLRDGNKILGELAILSDVTERKRMFEATQQSEENLRVYLESTPDAIYINDLKGNFLYGNKKAEEITGYTREELVGNSFLKLDLLPNGYIAKATKLLALNAIGRATGPDEFRLKRKDSSYIWVEINTTPIKQEGKRVVIGCVRDITERKKAELILQENRNNLSERVKELRCLYSICHLMFKYSSDVDMVLEEAANLVPPGWRYPEVTCARIIFGEKEYKTSNFKVTEWKQSSDMIVRGSKLGTIEVYYLKEKPAVDEGPFLAEERDLINGIAVIISEMVERKRAEEDVRKEKEFSEYILDAVTDTIFVFDPITGKPIRWNKSFSEISGFTDEEINRKKAPDDWYAEGDIKKTVEESEKLLSGENSTIEMSLITKDGKVIPTEYTASLTNGHVGGSPYVIAVGRDITERKRQELEAKELEQKALNASHLASIGEMASGMAHEINNPLAAVIGFSDLLLGRELPADIREDVGIISKAAQRVDDILKRMLTFARQYKLERKCLDINEIIETSIAMRIYTTEANNIDITKQLDSELPSTVVDGGQMQQVFLNIILNAEIEMKLAHGKGNLLIKTETAGNYIRISFKDDGLGIPKENLQKIFDPFFTTREVGQGTGLGLSVCHGIVAEHRGKLYAESVLGNGATFIVELPIIAEVEETETTEVAAVETKGVASSKILVVDDDTEVRHILARVLNSDGYKVETSTNANDAIDRLKNQEYSLILLDVKMPGMSGIELYENMQKTNPASAEKVLFITGDVMGVDTNSFFSKNNAPYITKPFNIDKLKSEVNRMLVS